MRAEVEVFGSKQALGTLSGTFFYRGICKADAIFASRRLASAPTESHNLSSIQVSLQIFTYIKSATDSHGKLQSSSCRNQS